MTTLELKIPPLLVLLVCILLAWQTAVIIPVLTVSAEALCWLAALLALGAAVLIASALRLFVRAKTTVHPHRPSLSTGLVTDGVYRFSRNPMYLAMAMLLLAWIICLGNILGLIWLAAFVAYITRFQIVPEEYMLEVKFGKDYREYCGQVRRWVGRVQ